jgi:hypothetical protein
MFDYIVARSTNFYGNFFAITLDEADTVFDKLH